MKKTVIIILILVAGGVAYYFWKKRKKHGMPKKTGNIKGVPSGSHNTGGIKPPRSSKTYTVKKGDTLSKIARKFGLSLKEIINLNPKIKNPNLIYPGQVITIS